MRFLIRIHRLNLMVKYDSELDAVFMALAHPARRAMLSRLGHGEATVGELAQPLEMTLPAVTKHIRVLSRARLIHQGRDSRWRPCRLETAPLLAASAWLEEHRKVWEARLDRLEAYLHTLEQTSKGRDDGHG